MNAAEATQLVIGLSTLIGLVAGLLGIPNYRQRKKAKQDEDVQKEVTHASVAKMLQQERDGLLVRIKEMEDSHRTQIADLKVTYEEQISAAKQRITDLETEVNRLYRRIAESTQHYPDNYGSR